MHLHVDPLYSGSNDRTVLCARNLKSSWPRFSSTRHRKSGVKRINILLMGGVGSGKSSFISSIDSIFEQRISRYATTVVASSNLQS